MFFCACSTNSIDCALDAESTVHVVGCASESRIASMPVPKLNPMRADFTAPLNRAPSSIQRRWYGLSWMTGGRLGAGKSVDTLADAVDVVNRDGAALPDFFGCLMRRFFERLLLALGLGFEARELELQAL